MNLTEVQESNIVYTCLMLEHTKYLSVFARACAYQHLMVYKDGLARVSPVSLSNKLNKVYSTIFLVR